MSTTRLIIGLAVLGLVVLAVVAVRQAGGPPTETLTRVKAAGVLTVGYANEAPFAYLDPKTGKVTGEAVEIARVIAGKLGIAKVDGVLTEWGALIPGLQAGRYDVIAAGMYITAPRASQVAFTDPTYVVGEGFLVPKGNPLKLHTYDDVVANPEIRFGVVAGTVEIGYAKTLGLSEDRMVIFPDNASGVAGLGAGRADLLAMTSLTIRDLLQRGADQELESSDPFTNPVIDGKPARGFGSFAMQQSDTALCAAFNAELHRFLGTPEHTALVAQFGFGPEHNAMGATVEQVLAGTAP